MTIETTENFQYYFSIKFRCNLLTIRGVSAVSWHSYHLTILLGVSFLRYAVYLKFWKNKFIAYLLDLTIFPNLPIFIVNKV